MSEDADPIDGWDNDEALFIRFMEEWGPNVYWNRAWQTQNHEIPGKLFLILLSLAPMVSRRSQQLIEALLKD